MSAYALFNAVAEPDLKTYHFDVRCMEFRPLARGTREAMESFLASLGVRAAPASWEIRDFCSPYFSDDPQAEEFLDRYPLVWRVTLHCASAGTPVPPKFALTPSDAWDSTYSDDPENPWWDWTRKEILIIGDVATADLAKTRAGLEKAGVARAVEEIRRSPEVTQLRISLGTLELPAQEDIVRDALDRCRELPMTSHWAHSVERFG